MICDIILRKEKNRYIARAKDLPEITVEENTRDGAIFQIRKPLSDYLADNTEIIQIEVPLPVKTNNPWIEKFGCFKDDPTFDDLQAEIKAYRMETDKEMYS